MTQPTPILGLHHITLVTADAQRNVDFYTQVLGMRLIKQTVNFDDPTSYHLYYGDETGAPSTGITFFEWPRAPRGAPGIGGTHHYALTVANDDALLRWKRRLTDHGVRVRGPYDRNYFRSIYFSDPDGTIIELATAGPGFTIDEAPDALGTAHQTPPEEMQRANRNEEAIRARTWPTPVDEIDPEMALSHGMHHISATGRDIQKLDALYRDLLGMQLVKQTDNFDDPHGLHWYWGVDGGKPGTLVTYFERNSANDRFARMGAGQTHHFALAVSDEDALRAWREKLVEAGMRVSDVRDRTYFKSIYTADPDGHIIELATVGPGFDTDEPVEELGRTLKLPPQYESRRAEIEAGLTPLVVPEWQPATAGASR